TMVPQPEAEQFRIANGELDGEPGIASLVEVYQERAAPVSVRTDTEPSGNSGAEVLFEHDELSRSGNGSESRQNYAEFGRLQRGREKSKCTSQALLRVGGNSA